MKIIVLCTSKYKDYDAIITAASESGIVVFRAYGMFRENSRRSFLRNPLTVAEISFTNQNQKYKVLKEASICEESIDYSLNAELLTSASLIASLSFAVSEDEDYKNLFIDLLKSLNALKNNKNPLLTAMTFCSEVFRKTGYEWEVNHCVRCGTKKSIVSFSFIEGGFVCKECLDLETDKLSFSPSELALLRNVYGHNDYNFDIYPHSDDEIKKLFYIFIEYINDNYSINISSDLLK